MPVDVGARLRSPKAGRPLPHVLKAEEAGRLLAGAGARTAAADDPAALRYHAVLELLYATGMRVGELCALDVDDVDEQRRVVRVMGKGAKERVVPFGAPADAALRAWRTTGRPRLARPGSGQALFLGARGGRATRRPPTFWTAALTCAPSRSCSGTPASPPPRSTRMSRWSGFGPRTGRPTLAR